MASILLTANDVFERALSLVPILASRAKATEDLRRIPEETVNDLRSAGLMDVIRPRRYGGLELEVDVCFRATEILASGCGSTGWCYGVWSNHAWLIGLFPREVQDEYYEADRFVLSASGFNIRGGTAKRVAGGYVLSGKWEFASGIDASSWQVVGAQVEDGKPTAFLLPRRDWTIEDNWYVSGLRGTGSKIVVIEDAFVPEGRSIELERLAQGRSPGAELDNRASYHVPVGALMSLGPTPSSLIGIAQAAVDDAASRLRVKPSVASGLRVAEAAAEVDAARLIREQAVHEILSVGARRGPLTIQQRVVYARNRCFIGRLCLQAVNRIFDVSGAHGLYDSYSLQRIHRDAHAAAHHRTMQWDVFAEQYARVVAGQDVTADALAL